MFRVNARGKQEVVINRLPVAEKQELDSSGYDDAGYADATPEPAQTVSANVYPLDNPVQRQLYGLDSGEPKEVYLPKTVIHKGDILEIRGADHVIKDIVTYGDFLRIVCEVK